MSWLYAQQTGLMYRDGQTFAQGYAGRYTGKNNGDMQAVKDTGPLPVGVYRIDDSYTHPHLGPITMDLKPDAANEMFGRDLFRIHGDSIQSPGMASHGCIVLGHDARTIIAKAAAGGDRLLEVVRDYKPVEAA